MGFLKEVDHIGIAVQSLDASLRLYTDGLGLALDGVREVPRYRIRIAMLRCGESHLELMEPLSPEAEVARFLERRGEGLHHICYRVEDIREALRACEAIGLTPITREPYLGAAGLPVVFLHPKSAHGVLVELVEKKAPDLPGRPA
ncbi:MAG: methylmalonyl-CoA epimerase [Deltaproteobacteria bacterium]|nr:methylmalonyl-CoA epimerase [Deltaproteobacteria bacterium]